MLIAAKSSFKNVNYFSMEGCVDLLHWCSEMVIKRRRYIFSCDGTIVEEEALGLAANSEENHLCMEQVMKVIGKAHEMAACKQLLQSIQQHMRQTQEHKESAKRLVRAAEPRERRSFANP